MQTIRLLLRDGSVVFSCQDCLDEFLVDTTEPFFPQLGAIDDDHRHHRQPAYLRVVGPQEITNATA